MVLLQSLCQIVLGIELNKALAHVAMVLLQSLCQIVLGIELNKALPTRPPLPVERKVNPIFAPGNQGWFEEFNHLLSSSRPRKPPCLHDLRALHSAADF